MSQPQHCGRALTVAAASLDAEFMRFDAACFARSIAIVPHDTASVSPMVVALKPDAVLRRVDVLPCGYLLDQTIPEFPRCHYSVPNIGKHAALLQSFVESKGCHSSEALVRALAPHCRADEWELVRDWLLATPWSIVQEVLWSCRLLVRRNLEAWHVNMSSSHDAEVVYKAYDDVDSFARGVLNACVPFRHLWSYGNMDEKVTRGVVALLPRHFRRGVPQLCIWDLTRQHEFRQLWNQVAHQQFSRCGRFRTPKLVEAAAALLGDASSADGASHDPLWDARTLSRLVHRCRLN